MKDPGKEFERDLLFTSLVLIVIVLAAIASITST